MLYDAQHNLRRRDLTRKAVSLQTNDDQEQASGKATYSQVLQLGQDQ